MSPLVLHPAAARVPSPARPWLSGVQAGRQAGMECVPCQPASQPPVLPACLPASLRTPQYHLPPLPGPLPPPWGVIAYYPPPAAD